MIKIRASSKKCEEVLIKLAEMSPWAYFGYSDELKQQMSRRHRITTVEEVYKQRDEMLAAVE